MGDCDRHRLAAFIVGSLYYATRPAQEWQDICIAVAFGGSSVSALCSLINRHANGWEFSDGTTYPDGETRERFSARIAPGFLYRPFLGAWVGYVVYVALTAGAFSVTPAQPPAAQAPPAQALAAPPAQAPPAQLFWVQAPAAQAPPAQAPPAQLFWVLYAGIAGLVAQTFIDKLKAMVDKLFGE